MHIPFIIVFIVVQFLIICLCYFIIYNKIKIYRERLKIQEQKTKHIEMSMAVLDNIKRSELLNLSLEEYFHYFEKSLQKDVDLEWLTGLFTELPYQEKKPYLTRRSLVPKDKRFKQIEIVYYDDTNKVGAIVWDFKITLRELVDLFGKPILHYEPYDNTVAFAFISKNSNIDVIKTRCSASSENEMIDLKRVKLVDVKNISNQILDLEFTFLQFSLKD